MAIDRKIQMWSYQVSHSVLLFRGTAVDAATRVDLMFRSVRLMRVRQRYESMTLDVIDPDRATHELGLELADCADRIVFTIRSRRDSLDYVVAGSLYVAEDDLEDFQPSSIDHRELAQTCYSRARI